MDARGRQDCLVPGRVRLEDNELALLLAVTHAVGIKIVAFDVRLKRSEVLMSFSVTTCNKELERIF